MQNNQFYTDHPSNPAKFYWVNYNDFSDTDLRVCPDGTTFDVSMEICGCVDESPDPPCNQEADLVAYFSFNEDWLDESCNGIVTRRVGNYSLYHSLSLSQQTRDIHPMRFQCWPTVFEAGLTLKPHCVNASCLLGWGQ